MRGHVERRPCHPVRAEPVGQPALGQRAHGAVQPPRRARRRRADGAAHRGHRCGAQRRPAPRCAARGPALARRALGRRSRRRRAARAVPPERADREACGCGRRARRRGSRLSVLLLARDSGDLAQGTARRGPAAALRRHLRRTRRRRRGTPHRRRARPRDAVSRRGRPRGGVRRPGARPATLPDRRHRRFRRRTRRTARASGSGDMRLRSPH